MTTFGRCLLVVSIRSSCGAIVASVMRAVKKADVTERLAFHEHVAAEIRCAIADGEAKSGERLPPARDLAAVLGVNANTVFRALRTSRDEGLLEFRRGRGITVSGTPERSAVLQKARELVVFSRRLGYRPAELARIIRTMA